MTARMKNFTPMLDDLVQKYGIITAAVWGRVWRYSQQNGKVCQATQERIANDLKLGRRTVIRHLQILIDDGYLVDHTPELRHRPHTYTTVSAPESHTDIDDSVPESHTSAPESHTQCATESLKETIKETNKKQVPDGAVFEKYSKDFGPLTPGVKDIIDDYLTDYPPDWILDAMQIGVAQNARNMNYVGAILKRWQAEGKGARKAKQPDKAIVQNPDGSMYV